MKKLNYFILSLSLAMMAVGCNKVERILPKKDGLWKATSSTDRYYLSNTLFFEETLTGDGITYQFEKDGTGIQKEDSTTINFTWEVNDDNDVLRYCEQDGSLLICYSIDILESSKDKQKWFFSSKQDGITDWQESEVTLERVQ